MIALIIKMKQYLDILINKRIFTYHTEDSVTVGMEVLVPFRNHKASGYVINVTDNKPDFSTKPIVHIIREAPQFTDELVVLADWISETYQCYRSKAFELILPK